MRTVALVGPTAAGKSTICKALAQVAAVAIITCDDFYLPRSLCPTFALEALPWPGRAVPSAFAERGSADFNTPGAVDWDRLCAAIGDTQQRADAQSTLLVEGHLLLGAHAGAAAARALCGHAALLDADGADAAAMDALWRRKWTRTHWGRPSYRERGVTAEEYAVYWEHYVWPAWVEHGSRLADAHFPSQGYLRIDALQPVERTIDALLATGWFPPRQV